MVIPTIGIDYRTFKRQCDKDGTMNTWNSLVEQWETCQNAVGYKWDTANIRLVNIFGDSFAIDVYKTRDIITLTMWDSRGHVALGTYTMAEYGFKDFEFNRLCNTMINWSKGIMPCSGCGKEIDYQKYRNQSRYAGVYCDDCF